MAKKRYYNAQDSYYANPATVAKKRPYNSLDQGVAGVDMYYAGFDSRRSMEQQDGAMLNEDRSAIANLPQDVKYHAWPKAPAYANYNLNDNISGVDKQMDEDGMGMRKHIQPGKY